MLTARWGYVPESDLEKEASFLPVRDEWAVLACEDEQGARVTVAGPRESGEEVVAAFLESGAKIEVDVLPSAFPLRKDGWPEDWITDPSKATIIDWDGVSKERSWPKNPPPPDDALPAGKPTQ